MAESSQDVIHARPPAGVSDGTREHEREIAQIGRGPVDLGEMADAQNYRDWLITARDDHTWPVFSVGDQPGDASLRRLGHAQLGRLVQDSHGDNYIYSYLYMPGNGA